MRWLVTGACRHEDPELFFPIGTTGPALQQIEAAKRVCGRCDVVAACLDWALSTGQNAGVWGGLSETERRTLKHLQRKQDQSHIDGAVLRLGQRRQRSLLRATGESLVVAVATI